MTRVLVVGGGPVGLMMGCELQRHGIACRVIDALPEPQPWSKAAAVMPRTMEMLRIAGVADTFLAEGRKMHGFNVMDGEKRLAHVAIQLEGTPFPFLLGIEQRRTEALLADHLRSLGGTFERPVTMSSFEASDDGVRAVLDRDGETETVEAEYLIGCDGAHSAVRKGLGLAFEGESFERVLWQADVRVDWSFPTDGHEAYAFPSDDGMMGALPLLTDGRYRLIALAPPNPEAEPTLEGMQAIAAQRLPKGTTISDPAWIAGFKFHGRLAERYRVGRVLLAGDAAHIHSPVGAQGMNLGIQDAANLGWKLALVLKGASPEALLDSYEAERRPIARGVVEGTDAATKQMMRVLSLRHPIATALRRQVLGFVAELGMVQSRLVRAMSQTLVAYPQSPIVGQHQSSIWKAELGTERGERPGLADWLRFGDGPGPGERVPDLVLDEGAPAATLHELLLGTQHTLLLFDGAAATDEGYRTLDAIATTVQERHGEYVRVFVVVPHAERPKALRHDPVILDADGSLHALFGAHSEALSVVRPDGYVAFRSQPAVPDPLLAYLATIFR